MNVIVNGKIIMSIVIKSEDDIVSEVIKVLRISRKIPETNQYLSCTCSYKYV